MPTHEEKIEPEHQTIIGEHKAIKDKLIVEFLGDLQRIVSHGDIDNIREKWEKELEAVK